MNTATLTPDQVRSRGLAALQRELGTEGMVRFLHQFDNGKGDYTKERHEYLDGMTLDEIVKSIKVRRSQGASSD